MYAIHAPEFGYGVFNSDDVARHTPNLDEATHFSSLHLVLRAYFKWGNMYPQRSKQHHEKHEPHTLHKIVEIREASRPRYEVVRVIE